MEKVILCSCPKCYVQVGQEGFCSSCMEDCAPTRYYALPWWRSLIARIVCAVVGHRDTVGYSLDGQFWMCLRCSKAGDRILPK